MKNKFCLLIPFFMFQFACSTENRESQITGTWTGSILKETENGVLTGSVKTNIKSDASFTQDIKLNGFPLTSKGTWKIEGKYLIMTFLEYPFDNFGPDDMTSSSEILELTENILILNEEELGRVVYKKE